MDVAFMFLVCQKKVFPVASLNNGFFENYSMVVLAHLASIVTGTSSVVISSLKIKCNAATQQTDEAQIPQHLSHYLSQSRGG